VCKLGGSLAGKMNVSWVVVVCNTNMHYIKSIRMFEDDVTLPEHAFVIQRGSIRVWVGGRMYVI
jgi:hypothetical protein